MNIENFKKELEEEKSPIIVEFWAGWCGPCKAMAPGLKIVADEMTGKVRLWKINADEDPDILHHLGVLGIPTMIGFKNGEEIARKTGLINTDGIRQFFLAIERGEKPQKTLTVFDRWFRLLIGIGLVVLGTMNGINGWYLGAAAIVFFSAIYDRCPIYKALAPKVKKLFGR